MLLSFPRKAISTVLFSVSVLASASSFAAVTEFVAGQTAVTNGDIVSYNGSCYEAQNNPGIWEVPSVNATWNWTAVTCPVEPELEDGIWIASERYAFGEEITHNGVTYIARWGNTGKEPGASNPWTEVVEDSDGSWVASVKYSKGDEVTHNELTYVAKWNHKGKTPGESGVWALVDFNWYVSTKYSKGAEVTHNGFNYIARWGNKGKEPGSSNAWIGEAVELAYAELVSPSAGTTLETTTVTFNLQNVETTPRQYSHAYLGTSKGGSELYNQPVSDSVITINNIPLTGDKVYLQLRTNTDGEWSTKEYEFDTLNNVVETQLSALLSPLSGSTLQSTSVAFTLEMLDSAHVYVGTTQGGAEIFNKVVTDSVVNINNINLNGEKVYARVWTDTNGSWTYKDYEFNTIIDDSWHDGEILADTLLGRSDGVGYDLVFVGDGFTDAEQPGFRAHVEKYIAYAEEYNPTLTAQHGAWNIHILQVPSNESGTDEPKTGTLVDTPFDTSFECSWVDRVICVDKSKLIDAVSDKFPQYDSIMVVANSTRHGGASLGSNIVSSSMSAGANRTIMHELGHLFARLDDEYTYGGTSTPTRETSAANTTIFNNRSTVKWAHWLDDSNIDMFEGGRYVSTGVWRPTSNSIMRSSGSPFYPVNLEAWSLSLYEYAGTHFSTTPAQGNVNQSGASQNFAIDLSVPTSQSVEWAVNGASVSHGSDNSMLTVSNQTGSYTVTAQISDHTGVIRKDDNGYSTETLTWNVQN
jgi:chitodextrinase